MNTELLLDVVRAMVEPYQFTAELLSEDDGSVTIALDDIDLVENAPTEAEARLAMARSILEYVEMFYTCGLYKAVNRQSHYPYVLKALLIGDAEELGEMIQCRPGESLNDSAKETDGNVSE